MLTEKKLIINGALRSLQGRVAFDFFLSGFFQWITFTWNRDSEVQTNLIFCQFLNDGAESFMKI
jgi:hypothetical protein